METKRRNFGFTIVELLTVMAIIAILMGLLVPALQQVRKLAKDVSQKAEFHTFEVALEQFHNDYGMYPESSLSPQSVTLSTVGAQKFAEALVGRDLLGFDTKSTWDVDTDSDTSNTPDYQEIYANTEAPQSSTDEQILASSKRRIGPYLNTENVESFQIHQLFNGTGGIYPGYLDNSGTKDNAYVSSPVLTDVYRTKRVTLPNGKTLLAGTPVLYFKADTTSTDFPDTMDITTATTDDFTATTIDAVDDYIYDINDNYELIQLYQMMKPTATTGLHHFDVGHNEDIDGASRNGLWIFYNTITNPKMTSQPRPYNVNSYILISAGNDGIYGTKDDIYNFDN